MQTNVTDFRQHATQVMTKIDGDGEPVDVLKGSREYVTVTRTCDYRQGQAALSIVRGLLAIAADDEGRDIDCDKYRKFAAMVAELPIDLGAAGVDQDLARKLEAIVNEQQPV